MPAKNKTTKKKSSSKKPKKPAKSTKIKIKELPYDNLRSFQLAVKDEIHKLHDATEEFVKLAAHHAVKKNKVEQVEVHVLEIGKSIDELEQMLFNLSMGK